MNDYTTGAAGALLRSALYGEVWSWQPSAGWQREYSPAADREGSGVQITSSRGTVVTLADPPHTGSREPGVPAYQNDGCRCGACKKAHADYMREWRDARKQ